MATDTLQTESAPATVVKLPTAAAKKVRQSWSRTRAADRKALLQFPDIYKASWERENEKRARESARLMKDSGGTTALMLAITLYNILDDKQRARAKGQILGHLIRDPDSEAKKVLTWMEAYDSSFRGSRARARAIARAMRELP